MVVPAWAKSRKFGAILWVFSLQYYVSQVLVAGSWQMQSYSWLHNTISDLGNTRCGSYRNGLVCSPLHGLMNVSFVTLGVTMIGGAIVLQRRMCTRQELFGSIGFYSMAAAGLGAVLVGVFPENTVSAFHISGAALSFLVGNLGTLAVSVSLGRLPFWLRVYGCVSGLMGLVALAVFMGHIYGGLGIGGVERIVGYPQSIWMTVFGTYVLVAAANRSGDGLQPRR